MGHADDVRGDADRVAVQVDEAETAVGIDIAQEPGDPTVRAGDHHVPQGRLPRRVGPDPNEHGRGDGQRTHHPLLDVGQALVFVPLQPLGQLPEPDDRRVVLQSGRDGLQPPALPVAADHLARLQGDFVVACRNPPHTLFSPLFRTAARTGGTLMKPVNGNAPWRVGETLGGTSDNQFGRLRFVVRARTPEGTVRPRPPSRRGPRRHGTRGRNRRNVRHGQPAHPRAQELRSCCDRWRWSCARWDRHSSRTVVTTLHSRSCCPRPNADAVGSMGPSRAAWVSVPAGSASASDPAKVSTGTIYAGQHGCRCCTTSRRRICRDGTTAGPHSERRLAIPPAASKGLERPRTPRADEARCTHRHRHPATTERILIRTWARP